MANYTTAEADYCCWLKEYPAVQVYILPFRSSHVRCSPGRPPLEKLHRGFPREPQTCVHLPKLSVWYSNRHPITMWTCIPLLRQPKERPDLT